LMLVRGYFPTPVSSDKYQTSASSFTSANVIQLSINVTDEPLITTGSWATQTFSLDVTNIVGSGASYCRVSGGWGSSGLNSTINAYLDSIDFIWV